MTKLVGYLVERSGRNIWSKGFVGSATRGEKKKCVYLYRNTFMVSSRRKARKSKDVYFFLCFFSYRSYAFEAILFR